MDKFIAHILVVDDDDGIRSLVKKYLNENNFLVTTAESAESASEKIKIIKFDLIILDIMMSGKSGIEFIQDHHKKLETPIILLTAKGETKDRIKGLELGADDYLAKPFSPKVLFSRVKAVLRRGSEPEAKQKVLNFGDFILDIDRYTLKKDNDSIALTLSEFGILRRLLSNRGKVLTRNQLLDDVQNDDAFIIDRNIDVHIAALRKKLGTKSKWIETVRGVGYRFKEELDN